MQIGRNDPCRCGSGKKDKKCCLVEAQPSPEELKKRRWSAIQTGLINKIMVHAAKAYGPEAIDEAYGVACLKVKSYATELFRVFSKSFFINLQLMF